MNYSGYSMVDEFEAQKYGFKKYLTNDVFLKRLNDFKEEYDISVDKLIVEEDNFLCSFKRHE